MNGEATALAVFSPSLSFPSLDEAISGLKAIATTQGFTLLENTGPYNEQYVGRGMASFRCATKDCEFFITLRKVIRQKIIDQVAGPDGQPPPESLTVEKWWVCLHASYAKPPDKSCYPAGVFTPSTKLTSPFVVSASSIVEMANLRSYRSRALASLTSTTAARATQIFL